MKERPINLKAWEVRAILDGRKTQFRGVVKPQPLEWLSWRGVISCATIKADEGKHLFTDRYPCARQAQRIRCPYGQFGDRLWVRETWRPVWEEDTGFCGVGFRAGGMPEDDRRAGGYMDGTDRWRPSIHMPRWASRITLEIESVRVERLQEISEEDAQAEGVASCGVCYGKKILPSTSTGRERYTALWEHINGPGSWAENPWVWAVTFRVV
jgi:hypothetical protein